MQSTGTRLRTAIYGGTFDPPHPGHLNLFHEACHLTPLERLVVIPAYLSNFKRGSHPVSFSDRFRMTELLIEDYRNEYPEDRLEIVLSAYEGERAGVSYSSETCRHFIREFSYDGKLDFVIGDDQLEKLAEWHDFPWLSDNVRFWCFSRSGGENRSGAEVVMVPSRIVRVSSTEIRAGGLAALTPSVRRYVDENQLYRA